ncbi:hypothetical protein [Listeria newyorkensis]|uniref:Esterase n=1 Tax=Listeria newyorkensis TaxID=1497681 RepID=A0A841YYM9_9LIST|nr:hypothetical protein [Listeria newyorkensis]MBC1458644.1 hypothetical protein [Listeria newyorkensis]
MLHGKHMINGNDTLVLVFQNAAKPLNDAIPGIYSGKVTQQEVAEMHERYTWMKFAQRVPQADYFFIKDHFSSVYGWYLIDGGKMIHERFNEELTAFIKKHGYKRVIAFGSSKGGTGALLYGAMNPLITDVFSLIPQIHVATFINKLCPNEKRLFFGTDKKFEKKVDRILFTDALYENYKKKKLYFYTGTMDIQFQALVKYREFLSEKGIDSELFLNRSDERHTRLVNQYTPFIFGVLEDLIDQSDSRTNQQVTRIHPSVRLLKEQ